MEVEGIHRHGTDSSTPTQTPIFLRCPLIGPSYTAFSTTKKSYYTPIDHGPSRSRIFLSQSPTVPDRRFQKGKFTFRKISFGRRHLQIPVTSTCLRLTCYHALVRHAYRPGQSELGMGRLADWTRKACSSPSAFPAGDLSRHYSCTTALTSKSRPARAKQLFASRLSLVMGTKAIMSQLIFDSRRLCMLATLTLCHHCREPSSCCEAIFIHRWTR